MDVEPSADEEEQYEMKFLGETDLCDDNDEGGADKEDEDEDEGEGEESGEE